MRRRIVGALVTVAVQIALVSIPAISFAQEPGKQLPVLSTTGGVRDALAKLTPGQAIEVTLTNGKSYTGKLGTIGSQTMIVSKLSGKEFYDALIRIDDVSSIELRVREN